MIRFRFVQDNMTELSVKRMCELAEVPRSSFYAWLTRKPSARDLADAELLELLELIREIYARSRNTYGVPRMLGQLQRRGHRIARSHLARLMRTNGLVGAHASKKWRRGRPDAGGIPDLLNRNFRAAAPNQRWVADITEFPTGEGKVYLAGIPLRSVAIDHFHPHLPRSTGFGPVPAPPNGALACHHRPRHRTDRAR